MCMKKSIRRVASVRRKMRNHLTIYGDMCPNGCMAYQHEAKPGVYTCPVCGATTRIKHLK